MSDQSSPVAVHVQQHPLTEHDEPGALYVSTRGRYLSAVLADGRMVDLFPGTGNVQVYDRATRSAWEFALPTFAEGDTVTVTAKRLG